MKRVGMQSDVNRRTALALAASAAIASARLAAPALAQGAGARTLRFVPQANLANFDPIWGTQFVVRNAATLVWDTLYGFDDKLNSRRQMVEAEQVSADGLTWTFRLRTGLKFHDGEPVRAQDAVASLARWAVRDPMGQMIVALQQELVALDDRTFKWVLKKPYPRLLTALGKNSPPVAFIMPERVARTDPFRQIGEYIGSGPMRFVKAEWVPGARAVFERFSDYVPRDEPSSWLAGGKRMLVDRVEWIVMPDQATSSAALQRGEIDWWEDPIIDLVPLLRRNPNIRVGIKDPLGDIGTFRMNWLHPPFNDVRARRAILMAMSQADYMHAIVGDDDSLWRPMPGYFTPGTPLYNEEGGEILKGARDIAGAKRLLAQSGYAGEPITCLISQDVANNKAMGDVTVDLLRRLGMTVDLAAIDWGTVGARRALKTPPGHGGWHMFHSWHAGAGCVNPATYTGLRANGDKAWFGWPQDDRTEAGIADWFDAKTLEDEKAVARRINRAALDAVVYAPTGFFLSYTAWRKAITGIAQGPLPFFWGVAKT